MGKEIPQEKKEKIEELAKEGATYKEISKEVGVSQGCAYNYGKKYKQNTDMKKFIKKTNEVFKKLLHELPQEKRSKVAKDEEVYLFSQKLERRLSK